MLYSADAVDRMLDKLEKVISESRVPPPKVTPVVDKNMSVAYTKQQEFTLEQIQANRLKDGVVDEQDS